MPNFERNLRQTLTYWEVTGSDQYNKPTFAVPVTLSCRWEDVAEAVIDKYGAEIVSKSRIFLAVPIRAEGYVLLGESVAADPLVIDGAQEVRQVKSVPDLRANKQMYTVWL
jgi:hypothetical protein